MILRDYQERDVARLRDAMAHHRRVLYCAATGSGKTVVFAYISSHAAEKQKRVVIAAHRREITGQISAALDSFGVRHGRIEPSHTLTDDGVQVAMIQTLARRIGRVAEPDLLVIDEAHHCVAGSYRSVAQAWKSSRVLGVTATPARLDGRGLGEAFDTLVLGPQTRELVDAGYLARYQYLAPPDRTDYSAVRTTRGDYAIDALEAAVDRSFLIGDAVSHYRKYLDGRPSIAFCVTVAHAEHVAAEFRAAGIRAASVDGSMSIRDRADRIAAIGDGRLDVLTSCQIISEGTDIPAVAGAILLRPTQSLALYLQMVGRCLRPHPDCGESTILDHAGNVHRHGPPDLAREWSLDSKRRKPRDVTVHTCEQCYRVFADAPGWRDDGVCEDNRPVGCILNVPERDEQPNLPDQRDGDLVEYSGAATWSRGLDIRGATGGDWYRLLALADTEDKLREIARARGYKRGWIYHIMRDRAGPRAA